MAVPPVNNPNPLAIPLRFEDPIREEGEPIARGIGHVTARVARVANEHLGRIAEEAVIIGGGGGGGGAVGGVAGAALGGAAGFGIAAAAAPVILTLTLKLF